MNAQNPWFRMYSEAIDDEKLRLLAFEDRWHYIAILCCKSKGLINPDDPLLMRKLAVKLGLDMRSLEEVLRRLAEVGLIDQETADPLGWDDRQFQSDSSSARVKTYREKMKRQCNVSVTAQEADTETDSKPTSSLRSEGEQVADSPKADQEKLFDEPEPLKAEPQSDDSLVSAIFAEGLPLMLEAKVSEKSARSLLGRLRSKLGDLEAVVVIEAMRREKPLDPSAWLSKVINARKDDRQTFAEWAADCKARGEKLMAGYQPVIDYCEGIDLPNEFMNLAWSEFKRQHSEGGIYADKRSDDWRAAFRIAVERGYMRLWFRDNASNSWALTTQGLQAQAITEAKERAAA